MLEFDCAFGEAYCVAATLLHVAFDSQSVFRFQLLGKFVFGNADWISFVVLFGLCCLGGDGWIRVWDFRNSICFTALYGQPCATSLFDISHGFNVLMSGVRLVVALVQLHIVLLRVDGSDLYFLDLNWSHCSISWLRLC